MKSTPACPCPLFIHSSIHKANAEYLLLPGAVAGPGRQGLYLRQICPCPRDTALCHTWKCLGLFRCILANGGKPQADVTKSKVGVGGCGEERSGPLDHVQGKAL